MRTGSDRRIKKARSYRSTRPRKPFSEVTKLRKECAQLKRANNALAAVNSERANRISHLETMIVAMIPRQHYTSMCRQLPKDPVPNMQTMAGMKGGDTPRVPASDNQPSLRAKKHARGSACEQASLHQRAKPRCIVKRRELDHHNPKQRESDTADGMDCEPIYPERSQVLHCDCAPSIHTEHVTVTCRHEAYHPCKRRRRRHTSTLARVRMLIPYLILVAFFFKGG